MKSIIIGLVVFTFFSLNLGANILVLEGLPSPSHHVLFRVVNEALAARGHNVTAIGADIDHHAVGNNKIFQ